MNSTISAISRRTLAIYLAVALMLLAAFGIFVARQADDENQVARGSSQMLAESAVRTQLDQLGRLAQDYAVWDDAYRNLTLDFRSAWADDSFGIKVWKDLATKVQGAFYVDGGGRTRYGVWDGTYTSWPISGHLGGDINGVIDQARRARSPITRLFAVNGVPELVAAAAVRPTTPSLADPAKGRGVLIWVQAVDGDFAASITHTYPLKNVHWVATASPDAAQLPLRGLRGEPAGALTWDQARPGEILLRRALMPGLVLVLLSILAGVGQARLTMRAATMLNAAQERSRSAAERADLMSQAASTDTLTGLLNRRGLAQAGAAVMTSARLNGSGVAILVVDLDRFKSVNDSHGHHVGDEVLQEVAKRLARAKSSGDSVARLGGDEFVILVAQASREQLEPFATRLIEALNFPYRCSVGSVSVGASIGMAFAEPGEMDIEASIRRADRALFAAKQDGRARWRLAA